MDQTKDFVNYLATDYNKSMKTWYRCPHCGQKIFQYDPGTAICKGVWMKCKGRDCGKIFEVIIE
jgi:hypothetical protein